MFKNIFYKFQENLYIEKLFLHSVFNIFGINKGKIGYINCIFDFKG